MLNLVHSGTLARPVTVVCHCLRGALTFGAASGKASGTASGAAPAHSDRHTVVPVTPSRLRAHFDCATIVRYKTYFELFTNYKIQQIRAARGATQRTTKTTNYKIPEIPEISDEIGVVLF